MLYNTQLPIAPKPMGLVVPKPTQSPRYWAQGHTSEDPTYNRILWKGLMGDQPYPAMPSGLDLRRNRAELLERYRESIKARKN